MKWTHMIFPQAVAVLCGCWISPRNKCEDVYIQNKPNFYKTGPWYTLTFANSYTPTPNVTRNTFNDYNHQSYKKKTQVATPLLFSWPLVVSINVSKNKMNQNDNTSDINKIRWRDLVKAPRNIGRSLGSVPNGWSISWVKSGKHRKTNESKRGSVFRDMEDHRSWTWKIYSILPSL